MSILERGVTVGNAFSLYNNAVEYKAKVSIVFFIISFFIEQH